MGDEINANSFRADKPDNLLDRAQKILRRIVEQQMRFIKKEYQFRLFEIADFGQFLEQFGQHPQQENRVETRRAHQFSGAENVDEAAPVGRCTQKIIDIKFWFAEKSRRALVFKNQQPALNRADRRGRDVPIGFAHLRRAIPKMLQERLQILEVDEQQALFVGEFKSDVENTFLNVVEFEQAGQQQGPHIRNSRPDGMPQFSEEVPEGDRKIIRRIGDPDILRALNKVRLRIPQACRCRRDRL